MGDSNITVLSLNVKGLRSKYKRKSLFSYLKRTKYDVICLQETYVTDTVIATWEKEWNGTLFFSAHTSHSCGQVILLRKGLNASAELLIQTQRILAISLQTDFKKIAIVNLYFPNALKEKLNFFDKVKNTLNKINCESSIVCGDFNTVLNNEKDIISGEKHDGNLVKTFNSFLIDNGFYDVWRIFNPEIKEFTWSRRSPFLARRLDYILMSADLLDNAFESFILSVPSSDHRACVVGLRFTEVKRGGGYFKMNNSLLRDTTYVSKMNELIDDFLSQEREGIIKGKLSHQRTWELLKLEIRDFTTSYSKEKSNQKKHKLADMYITLNKLDVKLSNNPDCKESLAEKEKVKMELEIEEQSKARAAQVRSRVKWVEEGEKNTRYFLGLEKVRAQGKVMDRIVTEEGEVVTGQENILKAQTSFFKGLYQNRATASDHKLQFQNFIKGCSIPKLSENQKNLCEGKISTEEALYSLKQMKNGSCPGPDGISTEFIKVFWNHLSNVVVGSFNESFESGVMSSSQRKAVITLIHKGRDLPRHDLKNWRPISLTNSDYKLMAKCLAQRLNLVIDDLIHPNQTGYLKGRQISTLLRTIDDVTNQLLQTNRPGLLVAVDFYHAFDCVSKEFMLNSFEAFGFGKDFLSWVKMLMNDTKSCVSYCNWLSEYFPVETGIRQGCPFSPLGFIVSMEILAIKIRSTGQIKGIARSMLNGYNTANRAEGLDVLKLMLYADDVTMFLRDKIDLAHVMAVLKTFENISFLKINIRKTEVMWLGSSRNCRENLFGFVAHNKIKILGMYFSNAMCASQIEDNWSTRIENCRRIIQSWERRNLSLLGKICILKTFLMSQWVYVMKALVIPDKVINEMNTLFFRFLWRKRNTNRKAFEKVKRQVLCKEENEGGLRMVDMRQMQIAMILQWVPKLWQSSSHEAWSWVPTDIFDSIGGVKACFSSNCKSKIFKGLFLVKSFFWKTVLITWLDHNVHKESISPCLWNNMLIRCQSQVLFFKDWIKCGIINVRDIYNDNQLITLQQLCDKVGNSPSRIIEYNVVKSALHRALRTTPDLLDSTQVQKAVFNNKTLISVREFRQELTSVKIVTPCSVSFWKRKFEYNISKADWTLAFACCKETRLRTLQYKILHNIYATNILLHKMKVTETNKCSLCPDLVDYLEHFFYECKIVKDFWKEVAQYIYNKYTVKIALSVCIVLFGIQDQTINKHTLHEINHVILIGKMSISIYKKTLYSNPLRDIFYNNLRIRQLADY